MNIDAKTVNKILTNQIQQHTERRSSARIRGGLSGINNKCKSESTKQHIKGIRDKNYKTVSADAEKAFDKIQYPFMVKP
jgi:hypothetical protein